MFRRIVEDYESRLVSLDPHRSGENASGKAEHERFGDGGEMFNVRLRRLALADGSCLDVHLGDRLVGTATVRNATAELVIDSRAGAVVPRAGDGDRIVITLDTVPLFAGVFVPD
jgi:hypothetical protein